MDEQPPPPPGGGHNDDDDDNDDRKMPAAAAPPPLSTTAAAGTEVDDEEDDDWSRQVEMDTDTVMMQSAGNLDDSSLFRMESVVEQQQQMEGENGVIGSDGALGIGSSGEQEQQKAAAAVPPPTQPELTMKEKLVLRERQRRIETERARLKRQFALSLNHGTDEDTETSGGGDQERAGERAGMDGKEDGGGGSSVAGTLGEESTMVHPDDEEAAAAQEKLGFNMERFLRNSDSFNPQLEPTDELQPTATDQGVVMERFLNDPVVPVVEASSSGGDGGAGGEGSAIASSGGGGGVQRAVSFEAEVHRLSPPGAADDTGGGPTENSTAVADGSLYGVDTDISMDVNASVQAQTDDDVGGAVIVGGDDDDPLRNPLPNVGDGSTVEGEQPDEAQVLRLTEAAMQDMAATEEASIVNAPPSEREDILSEVGELADFGSSGVPSHHPRQGSFSQDTTTTAMESSSLVSGRSGEKPVSNIGSDMSANDDTVGANPPSLQGEAEAAARMPDLHPETPVLVGDTVASANPEATDEIVNRTMRPGMLGLKPPPASATLKDPPPNSAAAASDATTPKASVVFVDDFEFDKDHDRTPQSPRPDVHDDSYQNLPDDVVVGDNEADDGGGNTWSPEGKMHVSPIHTRPRVVIPHGVDTENQPILPDPGVVSGGVADEGGYGSLGMLAPSFAKDSEAASSLPSPGPAAARAESAPLLSDVPPEIITTRSQSAGNVVNDSHRSSDRSSQRARISQLFQPHRMSVTSMVESVFSDVRSEEDFEKEETHNESALYQASSAYARAIPERMIALIATLCLEIPVLLMISGGSDALCELIGKSRYQLLMGFIPLTSAISGNVGLQASTLTTRAVSHSHVTKQVFMPWFMAEIGAALYLGIGMGVMLGAIAYFLSGMDFAFGLTIMVAQVVSMVTAGCTGTIAPLLFSFLLGRDSGKWGGPLETAIQDIVGSFAMVVVSYQILKFLGPGPIGPGDSCGPGVADALS